jgi:hypothetical protein
MPKPIKIIVLIIAGMFLLTGFVTNATAPPINNVTGSVTNTTAPIDYIMESDHSYANNFDYTWPEISQPGATQMRLHFAKLDLRFADHLSFLDKDGRVLVDYRDTNGKDFWSEWFAVDTLKLNLRTNEYENGYGFKIDQVETRPNPGSTPIVQPGFTPTEANGTSSPMTAQSTNVTPSENNTTSVALNTNTSEANYTAPSQNNSSYDLYGNTTPEKPTVSFYNNVTINNVPTKTDSSGANYTIPSQNNSSYGSCGNSICEGPTVSFYANVTSGTAPLKVMFTSSTTGNPNSYFWVFEPTYSSDWNSKHAVTALHTFQNPGVYTVSLTVNNAAGSSTFTRHNYITVY